MSCYHPLRAVVLGTNAETGKKRIKILANSDFSYEHSDYEYITVPCGRCIGCRLKYSRIWADRCMLEASYHNSNVFLTLTYDNEHLPEPLSGSPINPLEKRQLQLFIKRLRKKFPDQKIRYFACGEYGGTSMRPHYHLILFGLKLDDLKLLYKNDDQFRYYTSDSIYSCWSYGYHIITSVNWDVCAYVARYIVKKQYGIGASVYDDYNFPAEFTLMSRKPGIGRDFYEDHKLEIYDDEVYLPTEKGARIIRPNKYYDSLFDIDYPDYMQGIREDRKRLAKVNEALKSNLTNLTYLDRLKSEELVQLDKARALHRKEL